MRHGVKRNRLNRDTDHRRGMLNNLATSILLKGLKSEPMERGVVTTVAKAKVVRGLVERLITYAKKGDLSARRQAARFVKDPTVLQGLFSDLGSRYAKRAGGYTRVLKLAERRQGDSSELALIALVEEEISPRKPARSSKSKASKPKTAKKKVNITKSEAKPAEAAAEAPAAE
ncbi:MAG TPA: 50S ribosomal protein L17 [Fibrobacteres bacterium]|jgi:large subunit ribosomal protein L17|nr:50S ribosomal protein L17 [Fibrobacterota bacterium]